MLNSEEKEELEEQEWYECSVCCYGTNREYKLWKHVEESHGKQNTTIQSNEERL